MTEPTNAAFRGVLAQINALEGELDAYRKPDSDFHKAYHAELLALWKAQKKRAKFDVGKALKLPGGNEIRAQWEAKADAIVADYEGRLKPLKAELEKLADGVDLAQEKAPDWRYWGWHWSGAYASTGRGAHYARFMAQEDIAQAEQHGVEVEIRTETPEGCGPTYKTYVKLTPEGLESLKLKPSISLKEWVRRCWAKGVNPRVFNPFLPYGFEERHGLDYFGHERPVS